MSREEIKSYKDLQIWNKGIDLVSETYKATRNFPNSEQYVLVQQMQRAAVSIPSNIAEGYMRQHTKEYKQFLFVALGSLAELETQFIIAQKLGYVVQSQMAEIQQYLEEESKMILSLARKL